MGIALGLFRLTLEDRDEGAHGQSKRQVPAGRRRDGVVRPASGRGQIPARQRGAGAIEPCRRARRVALLVDERQL
jgi:hypothetical protein